MVELACTPFARHVERIHREFETQRAVFDLPADKWFAPQASGPDISVCFHGRRAANASGPAAGPHGQMAQNIVLSYLAGGRIMELKTVQIDDRLVIPRPCIDATTIGYNVEWSQELRLEQSLHEYVSGAMLVHMIRNGRFFETDVSGLAGEVIYDMSVGYDLAGIASPRVRRFIEGMLDATPVVDALRMQIPERHAALRDLDYPTRLSDSITLSTFHGCPADEIESICTHLITEYGVNVIIKMNPPMLGRQRLEHLLYDVMGYHDIAVHQPAYTSGLQFDESLEIVRRLDTLARGRGLRVGAKFSNTLEVTNHRDFFKPDCKVMYLSGQPLYVITMALAAMFRQAMGPDCPISFSAGIDQKNFPDAVACGIVPVTVCTDLLRPGGYARLPKYLRNLSRDMARLGADDVNRYVLARCSDRHTLADPDDVAAAGVLNTVRAAETAAQDPRYRAESNRKAPKRIGSTLVIFDCITCDKCIPVCPNDANFTYPLAAREFEYRDYRIDADGAISAAGDVKQFRVERSRQIANFSDYCNECGNCDTFCPEYGGPWIQKPTFFGSREEYELRDDHDGFFVDCRAATRILRGRIKRREYLLRVENQAGRHLFNDGAAEVVFDKDHQPVSGALLASSIGPHLIDMQVYHTLRLLLEGVLDAKHVNPVNAQFL